MKLLEGITIIESNPIPARWMPIDLENNYTTELSHWTEDCEPCAGLPALEVQQ